MKYVKKIGLGLSLCILTLSLVMQFTPQKASAATPTSNASIVALRTSSDAKFINATTITITIGGEVFTFLDRDVTDGTHEFVVQNSECDGVISFTGNIGPSGQPGGSKTGTLDLDYKPVNGNGCENTDPGTLAITINAQYANIWAQYNSAESITFFNSENSYGPATIADASPRLWVQLNDTSCGNLLILSEDRLSYQLILMEDDNDNDTDGIATLPANLQTIASPYFPSSCEILNVVPWAGNEAGSGMKVNGVWQPPVYPLGNTAAILNTPGGTPGTGGPGDDAAAGLTPEESCAANGGSLSFFICPFIKMIDGVTNFLDNQIISLLQVPRGYYANNPALKTTWARMRNVALFILVPIMLVMVISTALGFSFVDAYTIKRSLPRFVVAVMFIVLSWWLMVFLVDLTNDVGKGILGLMSGAFGGSNNLSFSSLFDPNNLQSVLAGAGLTVGALAGGGIFIAILILAPGVAGLVILQAIVTILGLFLAFLTLAIRQMLIVALLLFAPLAILSWIFPNNNKLWKLWWESFSKLLLMFPIIMIIIASGRIFSAAIASTGGAGIIGLLLKIIAYIAPYFLIPATFKIAGNLFGTLSGMVNNRSKGLFDRHRNFRNKRLAHTAKDLGERAHAGKLIRGAEEGTRLGNWNKRAQRLANINRAADTGIGNLRKDWRSNIASAIQSSEKDEQKKIMEDTAFNTWAGFDDVSGMAADVMLGNEHGIRRRLMKVGVGVRRNADGSVYRDADGNMEVVNEAALSSAVGRIMTQQRAGKRQEALRQGLVEAGTFVKKRADGTEYTDTEELDKNVSHVMRASRQYGDAALSQALVKKAGAGGTYYDDASDAWIAADLAAGDDGAARSDFGATFRGILTNAGRGDQGGGAFGKTMSFMDDLGKAKQTAQINFQNKQQSGVATTFEAEYDAEIQKLQERYTEHVMDNTPASVLFHHSMKQNYIEQNVIPIMQKRAEAAAKAAEGKPKESPEFANLMKVLSDIDNIHQQALATKPAMAQIIGDKLLDLKLETTMDDPDGVFATNSQGQTIRVKTVRALNSAAKNEPVWQRYHKEWVSAEDYQRQQAAQGQRPQGPDSNPGGTMGQPLGGGL
jgi:hypothetical protein